MRDAFKLYVDALHPAFERLIGMEPVKLTALPKSLPTRCVYLFSEGDKHLYVGRTNHHRMRQHSIPAAQHNQAVFGFRLARIATGRTEVAYSTKGSRVALAAEPTFAIAFTEAKARIRQMDLRFVEVIEPLHQYTRRWSSRRLITALKIIELQAAGLFLDSDRVWPLSPARFLKKFGDPH